MQDGGRPLGHRTEHLHHIHDLVRLLVQSAGRPLTGQHQHGRPVHVRIGNSRDEVGGAGAKRSEATGGLPGETPVDLCHERCALFVARENEPNRIGILERENEVRVFFPGNAEDELDALGFEAPDHQIRSFHFILLTYWDWRSLPIVPTDGRGMVPCGEAAPGVRVHPLLTKHNLISPPPDTSRHEIHSSTITD